MSGNVDTSQPADRVRFLQLIEGGGGAMGSIAVAVATAVQNCQSQIPETTSALLDLPWPCTYATAAARWLFRQTNGPHG